MKTKLFGPFRLLGLTLTVAVFGYGSPFRTAAGEMPSLSEPYVIESLATSYRFEADGTGRTVHDVKVRVQTEAGVQQLGQLRIPFVAGRNRVEVDFLRVHRSDGSVDDSSSDLVQELPAPVTSMFPTYSDLRILHVTMPSFRPGETLEYRWSDHIENPDAEDRFWMRHQFRRDVVVLRETLEVDVPRNTTVRLRSGEGLEPEVSEARDRRIYRWTHRNPEPLGRKDWKDPDPDVLLSNFESWAEVGAWYRDLAQDRALADDAVRRRTKELVAGAATDLERIEAIYYFVSREFRYLGISFGIGRYQPHPAPEILASGYGDCKDKHTLLAAMLAAAGYRADAALIGAGRKLIPEVPSPDHFNHVITAVQAGDLELWLDSTSQSAPFRYLGNRLRAKSALRIPASGTAELVQTPAELPFPQSRTYALEGEIDAAGKLTARVEETYRGDIEVVLRSFFLLSPRDGWKQMVQGLRRTSRFPWDKDGGDIEDLEIDNPTAPEEPLKLTYRLSVPGFLSPYGKEQKIDTARLLPELKLPEARERSADEEQQPTEVMNTFTSRMAIELPEDFETRPPAAVAVERDFATYRSDYRVDGRRILAEHQLEVEQLQLPSDRFRELDALRSTVRADRWQSFLLRRDKAPSVAEMIDVDALMKAALDATTNDDDVAAVTFLSRVIELEPDHAPAWQELGSALVKSGEVDRGVEALRRHVELEPFAKTAHSTLAWALEKAGDPAGAEAAYRQALASFPLDGYSNKNLGKLLYEHDRCIEAVELLDRAISISPDDRWSQMRLGICQLRIQRTAEGTSTLTSLAETATEADVLVEAGGLAVDLDAPLTAVQLLDRAIEIDPEHRSAFYELGRAKYRLGDLAAATAAYQREIDRQPGSPASFYALGLTLQASGRGGEAVAAFRKVVEIDPDFRYGHSMLAISLFHQDQFEEAEAAAEKAIEQDSEDAYAAFFRGLLFSRQGYYQEALPLLKRGLESAGDIFFALQYQDVLDYVQQQVEGGGSPSATGEKEALDQ